ncbi:hydrogenase small subunit [Lutispora saccharofermentans]|uniref:Hydrogenase small subunit n=1 Tax=Lutispora saccharofermentans TaxID=3024236 RepID=A0ABT1NED5_9FIRM|nr:hydrogenase small subunit [Lutispora saccharofermentans]MCQ1529604.1 hydrogenase small subunit [Lutispora saccharofermentans]
MKNPVLCPVVDAKNVTAARIIDLAIEKSRQMPESKMNLIWLEAAGCSGNIISLLNADNPGVGYLLKSMVNMTYSNSLMQAEGEMAYEKLADTLNTEFILVVEGAAATKDNGNYNIIARHGGRFITALEAIKAAGEKAKYVLAAGTCASYGGLSAAEPNPSGSVSIDNVLSREVIKVPGCPGHPDWVIGTIAHLLYFGRPELDEQNRPVIFYGITIHDRCTRRSYFDRGIFAKKLGDKECMFKIGCRGPATKTDCPVRQWNSYVSWPIRDNTPCIGCAQERFPDGMEPFVRY